MKHFFSSLSCLFLVAIMIMALTSADSDKTTTIFVIGDSTAANKDISNGKKERGWGMALQCYFTDDIRIDNHAVNGRSSISFFNEGRWTKVLEKMKPGDYVIIQCRCCPLGCRSRCQHYREDGQAGSFGAWQGG